ncbi:sigma-54 dependent transcriptional regulator [Desulfobacula sp.]|uniref:sigma-54-dependent transcriptional regulator n=1 Tax=Desulfobacula sp. TaxID=2593537 RepID=UPI0026122C68|nr:sigma-54 dependent transcriptional regulator [Desulfobacula sp.]
MTNKNQSGKRHLLLIEDEAYCYFFLTEVLKQQNLLITAVRNDTRAYERARDEEFDAILINLDIFSQKELRPIERLHKENKKTPIIVISDHQEVDFAIEVLRAGGCDYLIKPFNNIVRVEKAINYAFSQKDTLKYTEQLEAEVEQHDGMLGSSKKMRELKKIIQQIAPLDVTILISGESGSGKELIAKAIHKQGGHDPGSFYALNCGAIPDGLVESTFFGHEKGAFTGASQTQIGYMEKAQGGTLFLDEVGELSPKGQVTLLRFLQEKSFVRIGGVKPLTSNAHILAATNRNLDEEVHRKKFRADLYFRLNVVHIKAPALSERPEDIANLADYFARRFCLKNNLPLRKLTPQAIELLEKYAWPGNVRELENLMERLMATLPGDQDHISVQNLRKASKGIRGTVEEPRPFNSEKLLNQTYREGLLEFEKIYFQKLLEQFDGNITKAAIQADIHAATFHRKLKKIKE